MENKKLTESVEIKALPQDVFSHVDDMKNTGMHMSKGNMPMMGGSLQTELLSTNERGLGATYRMHGRVMGMSIDFTEKVTKWLENKEREWETIGEPKLLIMGGYVMSLEVIPHGEGTLLSFSIKYTYPQSTFWKIVAKIVGDWYARWCLKSMCRDAKNALEA